MFFGFPPLLSVGFYVLHIFSAAGCLHACWHATSGKTFDTDGLMIVARRGVQHSLDNSLRRIASLPLSLGHSLEERAPRSARAAVRALADLAPEDGSGSARGVRSRSSPLKSILIGAPSSPVRRAVYQ